MTIYASFNEVRPVDDVSVKLKGITYYLGEVKAVLATGEKYIIYTDHADQIWCVYDEANKVTGTVEFNNAFVKFNKLKCQSLHNLKKSQAFTFYRMLAGGAASACEGAFEAANASTVAASDFLDSINNRAAKRRYLAGVISSSAFSLLISLILYIIFFYKTFRIDPSIEFCAAALGGGAIGTILSATTGKITDARFDPDATRVEGYLNGALRVVYGAGGAIVAVLAFKAGLISSNLFQPSGNHINLFLIGVGGGFAERQAANIISTFTKDEKKDRSGIAPGPPSSLTSPTSPTSPSAVTPAVEVSPGGENTAPNGDRTEGGSSSGPATS